MKPQTTLLTIATAFLCAISITTQAQKDSTKAFLLSHNDQLVIGVYAGQNLTFPKSANDYLGISTAQSYSSAMTGNIFQLSIKYKLPQKLFFNTGLTYQTQNTQVSNFGGYDYPLVSSSPAPSNTYNNDLYVYKLSSNYIGVPLGVGYFSTNKKLTYYASFCLEFFYNYKYNIQVYDDSKGFIVDDETFYTYRPRFGWTYGLYDNNWAPLGVFGMLSFGQSYMIMPKIAVSYEATARFSNPLNTAPFEYHTAASLSLNLGLTYSIDLDNTGSFLLPGKEKDSKKHMAGFKLAPNFFVVTQPTIQSGLSFSYDFSVQFNLTNRFAIETGVVIDNYSSAYALSATSLGIPLIAKYYFPKENGPSYFIGAGVHMDWLNDFDWAWTGYWAKYDIGWIKPIGIIENGWDFKLGNNYVLTTAFGFENWIKPILLSNINLSGTYDPYFVLFGSIGMSYSF